jgi:hypothetical protein
LSSPVDITLGGNTTVQIGAVRTYNVASTVTIAAGSAIVEAPTRGSWAGLAEYSVGYAAGGDHTLNVNGMLVMNSSGTPDDVFGRLSIGVYGNGVLNLNPGGQVWLMGTTELAFRGSGSTGTLNIDGGLFLMEGDRTGNSTLQGYISAGRVYLDGSNAGISLATVEIEGQTFTTFARGAVQDPGVSIPDLPEPSLSDYVPHPATAKDGWWHWTAGRWNDLYQHDMVWERGESYYTQTAPSGIAGTGVHAQLGTVYDGVMGLKVAGMTMYGMDGSNGAGGSPIHDPICNTWVQSVDWSELRWGTLLLAFHDLPAGEYVLHSYHNNFTCTRSGDNVSCDSTAVQLLNMPSITVMALADAESLLETLEPGFDRYDDTSVGYEGYKHYPYQNIANQAFEAAIDLGCGTDFEMLQGDYDVPIQQVTSDSQLNTSLVRFRTDGSPVMVVYENGCCIDDTVRPGRGGNRSILNAFRLDLVRPVEAGPIEPCRDTTEAKLNPSLRWWPSHDTASYDVYFGGAYGNVEQATPVSPEYLGNVADGKEGIHLGYLELNRTYHWRLDQVTAGGVRKGDVWTFTTAPCSVIENFSSFEWYVPKEGDHGTDYWMFWRGYGSAAEGDDYVSYPDRCGDGVYPLGAEQPLWCVHGVIREKALQLEYYNLSIPYSEAGHVLCPRDWLGVKATAVSLWFRGEATNVSDRLYMIIEDADGSVSEIEYDGPADLKTEQFQRWAAQLDDISGVDLTRVKKVYVGVGGRTGPASGALGKLYIDDLALCVPHCLPDAARPAKDHNDDCVVNFIDHAQDSAVTGGNMQQYRDFAAAWLENTLWP